MGEGRGGGVSGEAGENERGGWDWFGKTGERGGVYYFQSDHSGLKSVRIGMRSGGYRAAVGSLGTPCPRGRFAWAPDRTDGCDVVCAIMRAS